MPETELLTLKSTSMGFKIKPILIAGYYDTNPKIQILFQFSTQIQKFHLLVQRDLVLEFFLLLHGLHLTRFLAPRIRLYLLLQRKVRLLLAHPDFIFELDREDLKNIY